MKYLSLLFLLILSQFTNGQSVFTKFEKVVMYDDFSYVSSRWEQKNSSSESFIVSDNVYLVKRLKETYFAISLPEEDEEYQNFEIVTSIKVDAVSDSKTASGGLVMKAQKSGDGAVILEINQKKEFRILVLTDGKIQSLFGERNDGWQKSKNLNSSGFNELKVATVGNEYDLYFNKKFERTIVETSFEAGRIGFYANALSGLTTDYIIVRANESYESSATGGGEQDQTYTELALVFKAKIDKQQKEINLLSEALNLCKSSLSMDTTSINENKTLRTENRTLNQRVVVLEAELASAKERMAYLESMKEDIESNTNGDLILNLTELLAREKAKGKVLQKENDSLKKELKESQNRY